MPKHRKPTPLIVEPTEPPSLEASLWFVVIVILVLFALPVVLA